MKSENGHSNCFTLERDSRKKKTGIEREYYIFRELVMSERTFKKDIELINTWFKDDFISNDTKRPADMLSLLFSATEPMLEIHQDFLHQIEQYLAAWEGKTIIQPKRTIGEILMDLVQWIPLYEKLVERLPFILDRINANLRQNQQFERATREFESRKGCYLPYTSFILKPAFHIPHFCSVIEKLLDCSNTNTEEYEKYKYAYENLYHFTSEYSTTFHSLINLVILIELQRDITGMDNVVQSGRRFIRQGCLLKLSKKGYQQRLFFLFSDILIYTSRSSTAQFQFKVHGNLPLQNIMVEETEPKLGVNHCFTIYAGDRALMVAANFDEERKSWIHDLTQAAANVSHVNGNDFLPLGQTIMSSNELLDTIDCNVNNNRKSDGVDAIEKLHARSNTMAHVCWHRNWSISSNDYEGALTTCLSGYLLRKFKNSSGWQKLWVVFTNFCLFFYKSYQEDFPLASLPLLGYVLNVPNESDNIVKSFVFKLQFKGHVYFFRTESEYMFNIWMEVLKNATER